MMQPSAAERGRTVLEYADTAVLATLTSDFEPFLSHVPIICDGAGNPIMVLTNLDPHVGQAHRNARAGITVAGRLSITGQLQAVPGVQQLELQPRYLATHPDASRRVESLDCSWLRLQVSGVCDRAAGNVWLDLHDWANAAPDPLHPHAAALALAVGEVLGHDLLLLARSVGGRPHATAVEIIGVDRYGLEVTTTEPGGTRPARVPFSERIDDPGYVVTHLAFLARLSNDRAAASAAVATMAVSVDR